MNTIGYIAEFSHPRDSELPNEWRDDYIQWHEELIIRKFIQPKYIQLSFNFEQDLIKQRVQKMNKYRDDMKAFQKIISDYFDEALFEFDPDDDNSLIKIQEAYEEKVRLENEDKLTLN